MAVPGSCGEALERVEHFVTTVVENLLELGVKIRVLLPSSEGLQNLAVPLIQEPVEVWLVTTPLLEVGQLTLGHPEGRRSITLEEGPFQELEGALHRDGPAREELPARALGDPAFHGQPGSVPTQAHSDFPQLSCPLGAVFVVSHDHTLT